MGNVVSFSSLSIDFPDFSILVVIEQNLLVGASLLAHDGSTNLAESDTVAPSVAVQDELAGGRAVGWRGWPDADVEPAALQMGGGEQTPDFEFLSQGVLAFVADELHFPDSPALAAFQRDEVGDGAKVDVQFRAQPEGW